MLGFGMAPQVAELLQHTQALMDARARILVVDDSAATARSLADALERAGLEVQLVGEGAAAVKAVQTGAIDLVLLDVALPGMDGLQVLRLLRASQTRRHLPVIMMSVKGDRAERTA